MFDNILNTPLDLSHLNSAKFIQSCTTKTLDSVSSRFYSGSTTSSQVSYRKAALKKIEKSQGEYQDKVLFW